MILRNATFYTNFTWVGLLGKFIQLVISFKGNVYDSICKLWQAEVGRIRYHESKNIENVFLVYFFTICQEMEKRIMYQIKK